MSSVFKNLHEKGLIIDEPRWLSDNIMFEGLTGSVAYGVSGESSDIDVVGFCVPPKKVLFPHLNGEIIGFGTPSTRFDQFQMHHIRDDEKEYDIVIYSIVKFFQLVMENNPNMVDNLFLPRRCIVYSTNMYEHIRSNRKIFLHKGSYYKFIGYAYSQLSKIKKRSNSTNPKRAECIEKFGYDTKFSYHIVRLLLECEQILTEHDLDLEKNSDILKSIRNGEWSLDKIIEWFGLKEKSLETAFSESKLQNRPDESKIKKLLLECLEMHYGDLSTVIKIKQDENDKYVISPDMI